MCLYCIVLCIKGVHLYLTIFNDKKKKINKKEYNCDTLGLFLHEDKEYFPK